MELVIWPLTRLALAVVCVTALMVARWHHERQQANSPRAWLERRPLAARADGGDGGRIVRRLPTVSHPLYWLGLTTSAALAAQAIAALVTAGQ